MSKPYLSVVQQIRNLKDVKGLIINNEKETQKPDRYILFKKPSNIQKRSSH